MAPSKERAERGGQGPLVFCAVALLLLLPVFYFLSFGPVVWLTEHDMLKPDARWLEVVYYPLAKMQESSTTFDNILQWYVGFFTKP